MIIILSPAKTLDFTQQQQTTHFTRPVFEKEADYLALTLNAKNPEQLSAILNTNVKLTELTFNRFQNWNSPKTKKQAKQAVFVYDGLVFKGLDALTLNERELQFAQSHLRILSGLYGVLRPLDKIRPHRLEMAARLNNDAGKDLYDFWRDKITMSVKADFRNFGKSKKETVHAKSASPRNPILINLASDEYSSVINYKLLPARIITPTFKDYHKGSYTILSTYAKRARGMMTRFIIQNAITDPQEMKLFESEGYYYCEHLSDDLKWVFTRG